MFKTAEKVAFKNLPMIVTIPVLEGALASYRKRSDGRIERHIVMESGPTAAVHSLMDPTWLDFFEEHMERAEPLIKDAVERMHYDYLGDILRNKGRYPRLNGMIDKIQAEIAADPRFWRAYDRYGFRYI